MPRKLWWEKMSPMQLALSWLWNAAYWYGRDEKRRTEALGLSKDRDSQRMAEAKRRHIMRATRQPFPTAPWSFFHPHPLDKQRGHLVCRDDTDKQKEDDNEQILDSS